MDIDPVFVGTFFGHTLKFVEGHYKAAEAFNYKIIQALLRYLKENNIDLKLAKQMLPVVYEFPKMDFPSVLDSIHFKKVSTDEIYSHIPFLKKKYAEIGRSKDKKDETNWIMGELKNLAVGNIPFDELQENVRNYKK